MFGDLEHHRTANQLGLLVFQVIYRQNVDCTPYLRQTVENSPDTPDIPDRRLSMAGLPPKLAAQLGYPPRGMDCERAASYVGFGKTKFLELVESGVMPGPLDIGGSPRWDRVELDAAFEDLKERRKDPVQRGRDRIQGWPGILSRNAPRRK